MNLEPSYGRRTNFSLADDSWTMAPSLPCSGLTTCFKTGPDIPSSNCRSNRTITRIHISLCFRTYKLGGRGCKPAHEWGWLWERR